MPFKHIFPIRWPSVYFEIYIYSRQATYFLFAEAIKQIFGIHQGISPLLHKEMP